MQVIGVLNQKGGSTKTTVSINLAATLAESMKTVLVDVDPQKSASFWAQQIGDKARFDFITTTDTQALTSIRTLGDDVAIIDTPGSFEGDAVLSAVIPQCDMVIIPTEASALSIEPLRRTAALVGQFGVPYRAVLSRVDPRSEDTDLAEARSLLDALEIPYFHSHIRAYRIHFRAAVEGRTVATMGWTRSARHARDDFKELAKELTAGTVASGLVKGR